MTEKKDKQKTNRKATKEQRDDAAAVVNRMQESGEYARLQEQMLIQILLDHPQWFDAMRQKTRETLQRKEGGVLDITLDELSMELVPAGEAAVPEELKQQFMSAIESRVQANRPRR